MNKEIIFGTADITQSGIKKLFRNSEPINALFELVWNGFDASATRVDVEIKYDDLDSIENIWIKDNGSGINFRDYTNNFWKFNESAKANNIAERGANGRGRLAFHLLCLNATWHTKHKGESAKITIHSDNVKKYSLQEVEEKIPFFENKISGTCVELYNITKNIHDHKQLKSLFSNEFGWFLALKSKISLYINNDQVSPPDNIVHEKNISFADVDFVIKIIQWNKKPGSEKSYNYFMNLDNKIAHKELSNFNNKSNFYTSSYIYSTFFDNFMVKESGSSLFDINSKSSPAWKEMHKELNAFSKKIYDDFLRKYVDMKIDYFEKEGYFPSYKGIPQEHALWRKNNTKSIIKSIYLSDPTILNNISTKQGKIIIRLIDKMLVSNENEDFLDILENIIDLNNENMKALSSQIKKSKLENIISTIEILQKRFLDLNKLEEIMTVHYKDILETPDLQKIIENNTWLFGDSYEMIGAEEDTFAKTSKKLRDTIKDIDIINDDDVENNNCIIGAQKQIDLF